jgi:SSS family transporter
LANLQPIDYAVLVFYLVLVVGVGFYFRRFVRGGRDFFVAGNLMPWWVAGLSVFMGQFTAWTFTGAAGMAYKHGTTIMFCFMSALAGYLFAAFVMAPRWRRSRVLTPVQFLRQRYNPQTIKVFAWFLCVLTFLSSGISLSALSVFFGAYIHLHPNLVLNVDILIVICGFTVLIYTLTGGEWAVAFNGVLEFIILLMVSVFVVPLSLAQVGGLRGLIAHLPPGHLSPLAPGGMFDPHGFKTIVHIFGWMIMLATSANTQKAAQRYFSVPDERHARNCALVVGFSFFLWPILFFIPPLVATITHPEIASQPKLLDTAYAVVARDLLPVGMIGLMLAAMASATMSTVSAAVNMIAGVLSRDILQPMLKSEGDDKRLLAIGKIATLIFGAGALGVAILVNHGFATVFDALTKLWAWGGLSYAVPVIVGLLVARTSKWAALVVLPVGTATAIICTQVFGFLPYGYTVPITLAVSLATFFGSALFYRRGRDPEYDANLHALFSELARPVNVAEEVGRFGTAEAGPSPLGLAGVCTVLIAAMLGTVAAVVPQARDRAIIGVAAGLMGALGLIMWWRAWQVARTAKTTIKTEV